MASSVSSWAIAAPASSGRQLLEHLLAHRLVEMGEQLGVQLRLELGDQRRALVIAELLEQIGLVGGMERGDQLDGALDLTGVQRLVDDANQLLRQDCRRSAVRLGRSCVPSSVTAGSSMRDLRVHDGERR